MIPVKLGQWRKRSEGGKRHHGWRAEFVFTCRLPEIASTLYFSAKFRLLAKARSGTKSVFP